CPGRSPGRGFAAIVYFLRDCQPRRTHGRRGSEVVVPFDRGGLWRRKESSFDEQCCRTRACTIGPAGCTAPERALAAERLAHVVRWARFALMASATAVERCNLRGKH